MTNQETKNELSEIVAALYDIETQLKAFAKAKTFALCDWRRDELDLAVEETRSLMDRLTTLKDSWEEF